MKYIFKYCLLAVFPVIISVKAGAQKLPNVQTESVRAPTNIKIDGDAVEWNNEFHAYNHATEVFYTVSNDAENLYLTVQSPDQLIIQKIAYGGITFIVNNTDKKKVVTPVSITYPLIPGQYSSGVGFILRNPEPITGTELTALNKQISDHIKEIRIIGIKEIPDSSISVYNDLGIKAAQYINNKKTYTYELAVPLKYLQQVIDLSGTFKYTLLVNGLNLKGTIVLTGTYSGSDAPPRVTDRTSPEFVTSPTYFSGQYTLAKK